MFQDYVNKSTKKVLGALEAAIAELVAVKQNVLTPDFVLLARLGQPDNEALAIIERMTEDRSATVAKIREEVRAHYQVARPVEASQIVGSKEIGDVFTIAYEEAKKATSPSSKSSYETAVAGAQANLDSATEA